MVDSPEHERRHVQQYVEMESNEPVVSLEKVTTVGVYGQKYDVWDVYAESARYWAITNMLNLYSQERFRSMDETISFHIGLMTRLSERNRKGPNNKDASGEPELLNGSWRRFGQAIDALNIAHEVEEYQSVAIRCREALLSMVRELAAADWLPSGPKPKVAAFKEWASLIFGVVSEGRLRSYLITVAEKTWDLAVSLQHDTTADELRVEILLDSVSHLFGVAHLAILHFERSETPPCPKCGSRKISADFRPESGLSYPYFVVCGACGWEEQAKPMCEAAAEGERAYFEKHGQEITDNWGALQAMRDQSRQPSGGPDSDATT